MKKSAEVLATLKANKFGIFYNDKLKSGRSFKVGFYETESGADQMVGRLTKLFGNQPDVKIKRLRSGYGSFNVRVAVREA